jgi:hypothetical protein
VHTCPPPAALERGCVHTSGTVHNANRCTQRLVGRSFRNANQSIVVANPIRLGSRDPQSFGPKTKLANKASTVSKSAEVMRS